MKKILLSTVMLCLTLFTSCSSEGGEDLSESNLPSVKKLLTRVTRTNYDPLYENPLMDTLIYNKGKLVKIWSEDYGTREFVYGSNGKISSIHSGYSSSSSYVDQTVIGAPDTVILNQHYDEDNRLIAQTDESGTQILAINYDSENRVSKVHYREDHNPDSPLETIIFTSFDERGNALSVDYGYNFTYDNNVNPLYVLFQKFGFFNIGISSNLNRGKQLHVFPNNVETTINKQNELLFSAIYSYDSDKYPIYNNYSLGSYSNFEEYEY